MTTIAKPMLKYAVPDSIIAELAGHPEASFARSLYGFKSRRQGDEVRVVCSLEPGAGLEPLALLRAGSESVVKRLESAGAIVEVVPWASRYGARARPLLGGHQLERCRVAIPGVGSVGAMIALLVAKAGAEVILVDSETVAVENLERTPYRLTDVGDPKVDALTQIILETKPDASVVPLRGTYEEVKDSESFRNADLYVNAASDAVGFALAADFHGKAPIVFPGMHARAASGEVFVSGGARESHRACFACFRRRIRPESVRRSPNYGGAPGELAAEPGLGADIMHVVSAAASICIHLLTEQVENILSFERQLLLLSHRNGGLLRGAFETVWASVARDPDCPNHEDASAPAVDVREVLASLPEAER